MKKIILAVCMFLFVVAYSQAAGKIQSPTRSATPHNSWATAQGVR